MIAYRCGFIHLTVVGLNPATMQDMIDTEAQALESKAVTDPTSRRGVSIDKAGSNPLVGIGDGRIVEISTDKHIGRLLMNNLYMYSIGLLGTQDKGRAQLLLHLLFECNRLYLPSQALVAGTIFFAKADRI